MPMSKRDYFRWKVEDINALLGYIADGKNITQISTCMRIDEDKIRRRCALLVKDGTLRKPKRLEDKWVFTQQSRATLGGNEISHPDTFGKVPSNINIVTGKVESSKIVIPKDPPPFITDDIATLLKDIRDEIRMLNKILIRDRELTTERNNMVSELLLIERQREARYQLLNRK